VRGTGRYGWNRVLRTVKAGRRRSVQRRP
jgi:hypothetical protein